MRALHDVFCRVFREKVRQICLFVKPYTECALSTLQVIVKTAYSIQLSLGSLFSQVLDMLAVACSLSVIRVGLGPKM